MLVLDIGVTGVYCIVCVDVRSMSWGQSFFDKYDELDKEIEGLGGLESSHASAKEGLQKARAELAAATRAREASDAFIKEQVDRIELVESHWFYGTTALQPQLWFRGGTQGKIGRAQAKLDKAKAEHGALAEAERVLAEERVPSLEREERRLHTLGARKVAVEKERAEMRVAAIAANPSQIMLGLLATRDELQTAVEETGEGATAIKGVAATLGLAREQYEKARGLSAKARTAERDAEAVVALAAARHMSSAPPPESEEPCLAVEHREKMRAAAMEELRDNEATLTATVDETSAGIAGLKKCARRHAFARP